MLLHVLDYLGRKETPYTLIDTHAGAGIYDLTDDWARTSAEAEQGVLRVQQAATQAKAPPLIRRYLEALQTFNEPNTLRWYPGSPWLGLHAMREQDRLRLFEMHPNEGDILTHNLGCLEPAQQRQAELRRADGFSGLKAFVPPPSRRGMAIIDPSYEDKLDYKRVLQTLEEGLKRFATGTYFVWYPLVQRNEVQMMVKGMQRLAPGEWLHVSLQVCKPSSDGHGLFGSGVFVINPPYTLGTSLNETMPWLTRTLGQDKFAAYTLHTGDGSQKKNDEDEQDELLAKRLTRSGKPNPRPQPGAGGARPARAGFGAGAANRPRRPGQGGTGRPGSTRRGKPE